VDHSTARNRYRLTHAQVARNAGEWDPQKLGKLDKDDQEPWKLPLPTFIGSLYRKRFGKDRSEAVYSLSSRLRMLGLKV